MKRASKERAPARSARATTKSAPPKAASKPAKPRVTSLAAFHEATRAWFEGALGPPTRAQSLGWEPIGDGRSTLLLAPTGSGKTLAAFLSAIDRLLFAPRPPPSSTRAVRGAPRTAKPRVQVGGVRVLYVSPLKALAVDVEKNLRAPLAGIVAEATRRGLSPTPPAVQIRTGDTPAAERVRMQKNPPEILITTPESLYLLLTSGARDILAEVETVIVDEIHQLVANKRGAHLFVSLERLEALRRAHKKSAPPLQRVGLSATQRPLDEVARLLGGFDGTGKPRPVDVVDASEDKRFSLRIEVPDVDLGRLADVDEDASGPAASLARRSIWPHLHERLVELIRAHRSTMIFVNSRRLAERLAAALNELAGQELALAHHGSIAREQRVAVEDRLKQGTLPAIVATSSLELGIDMAAVDLVVQVEAPPSIAAGLQRVGRAGHSVGATSSGVILPKHRADLLACAAALGCMRAGDVEETYYPRSPLDVAAQQIVATVAVEADGGISVDALYKLLKRAAPFAELPHGAYLGLLDLLSGRYPSDEFAELRPRITWDRVAGTLRPREGALRLAIANGGTIPDRGLYGVYLAGSDERGRGSKRVGELDEEMVFELHEGDVFLLGASSWRTDTIELDRVLVTPASGEPGRMPFWHGDRLGRSRAFGGAVGELTRVIAEDPTAAVAGLAEQGLDASAAKNCVAYVVEELQAIGEVPSDKVLVLERFLDEVGDWRVCILSPFGARVHAPWATAILKRLRAELGGDADVVWSDDGIVFRLAGTAEPPRTELFLPTSDEIEGLVTAALADASLFAARFRENAARALLLPRRRPGQRTPLWAQRRRAGDLLRVASRYPAFPMILETYRECLRDVFDLPGLLDLLQRIETRHMRVVTVDVKKPSPFAASLLFSFVANFIYDGDAPLAERRAQALTIDHVQLRELLGESELRTLLDPEIVSEHEKILQRRNVPLRHADGLHDLLLAVGDLSLDEILERAEDGRTVRAWITELEDTRRIFLARIAGAHGKERYAAVEDATRLRDGLGVALPRGLPAALLEAVADPLGDLVGRYARTHGPFTAAEVAERLGLGVATVEITLERLLHAGRVVEGAFRPRGVHGQRELCDAEVLRALRAKALARLRREVEPVEPSALGRFLPEWQGIGRRRQGPDALLAVIAQLEGCPLPASALESEILPARIDGFRAWDLDALCAAGEVVWAGVEPLGVGDGRIALYLAEHEPFLAIPAKKIDGELASRLRALLERRGAVFFPEIARELGGFTNEIVDTLWDMVWAGEVTNDTCEALRSYLRARGGAKDDGRPRARHGARGRVGPPGTEGRWSLRASRWLDAPSETERRAALARTLLERYGVLTREAVAAEGIVGGFSAVYDVLKAMEESGRVRRGYFLAGRGATQFALPGADDRLRALRAVNEEERTFVLASLDPANPYGAALPWPAPHEGDEERARPQRAAGTRVLIHGGVLVGFLSKSAEMLLTFLPNEEPAKSAAARGLAEGLASLVVSGKRKALHLATIDGIPAAHSPLVAALTRAGFQLAGTGLLRRRTLDLDPLGAAREVPLA